MEDFIAAIKAIFAAVAEWFVIHDAKDFNIAELFKSFLDTIFGAIDLG